MSETRLWNDVVREKLARLEADMQLVMVRLDRLEAVQGTGLSVHQALSALDRYEAQEEHDAALVRRIEALERSLGHEVEAREQAEREADDSNIVHEHQNMTFGEPLVDERTGKPFEHVVFAGGLAQKVDGSIKTFGDTNLTQSTKGLEHGDTGYGDAKNYTGMAGLWSIARPDYDEFDIPAPVRRKRKRKWWRLWLW